MRLEFIKQAGGVLVPADDVTADKLTKFKTGEQYQVDIKRTRNPAYHRKIFAFMNFCFQYWKGTNEFQDEAQQFDEFRNQLTIMAGYYDQVFDLKGQFTLRPKSLSFASMSQDEFEACSNAMIQAALTNIFRGCDESIQNRLYEFF